MDGLPGNVSSEGLLIAAHAVVLVAAVALAVYGIVRAARSNREIDRERLALGLQTRDVTPNRARKARIRALLRDPGKSEDATEVGELRLAAMTLRSQRGLVLNFLPLAVVQGFGAFDDPGPRRITFTVLFIVFMVVSAVILERDARLGAAFLRRYPSR
ncbi:hypothetical protein Kisp01_23890 [Kineosporia sp. NBRC 101677]|uniref:hypothetical protein n=1 Tax=Kineosporia sp. NBRC 101677 TaxID=3032197 RepID=UPI0024A0C15F|nr:hypothetical protein [Kineosporia sp. NBRC 101677]GLY15374.1 hypothetical protein Kisp01_23890 [Kineosporia sp. NBRC 101677]